MEQAIALATENARSGNGGPFGVLIVKDGAVIATGVNEVTSSNDPTAHAEVVAIRNACRALDSFQLSDCEIYTSCEPCPMCLGAIYWSRAAAVYYASTHADAASAGFDDSFLYDELAQPPEARQLRMVQLDCESAAQPFAVWALNQTRVDY